MQLQFLVQGSSIEPYEVIFSKDGDEIYVTCTCQAAEMGKHCKHRIGILDGDTKNIVSDNENEVAIVRSWLEGSLLKLAYNAYKKAEANEAAAKKRLTHAKNRLALTMNAPTT